MIFYFLKDKVIRYISSKSSKYFYDPYMILTRLATLHAMVYISFGPFKSSGKEPSKKYLTLYFFINQKKIFIFISY